MRPLYAVAVWIAAAAHFVFLLYLPLGGFLALRWRRTIAVHVAAVLWALGSVALDIGCPLTDVERWARSRAGMGSLEPSGFIDHYVTGVLYPAGATGYAQAAVFSAVLISWVAYLGTARRRPPVDTRIKNPE